MRASADQSSQDIKSVRTSRIYRRKTVEEFNEIFFRVFHTDTCDCSEKSAAFSQSLVSTEENRELHLMMQRQTTDHLELIISKTTELLLDYSASNIDHKHHKTAMMHTMKSHTITTASWWGPKSAVSKFKINTKCEAQSQLTFMFLLWCHILTLKLIQGHWDVSF